MGTIQSSVGLITGVPIKDTVDQLMAISAQPRDRLQARTDSLKREQVAITELTALAVGIELSGVALGKQALYQGTAVKSSNTEAVSVTKTGDDVAQQNQQVRITQLAQTNSFSSRDLGSSTQSLGYTGRLEIQTGGFIDHSAKLSSLNGGAGVAGGQIRITDRSGAQATIDLSDAVTVDDVINTINDNSDISIKASTSGDRFVLTDTSGGAQQIKVEELNGGTTAAGLGLAGINASADSVSGEDINSLSLSTQLASLRDGRGLDLGSGAEFEITFRDGSSRTIDLSDFSRAQSKASGTTTNNNVNAQLTVSTVGKTGDYDNMEVLFVHDDSVTAGNETVELLEGDFGKQLVFHIDQGNSTSANLSAALAADSTLASKFTATAGGDGTGAVSAFDSAVLTGGMAIEGQSEPDVEDFLRVLNDADPKLRVSLSASGDGFTFEDLSGGTGDFTIADAQGSTAASDLGIATTVSGNAIQSDELSQPMQSVNLSSLNGGNGVGELTSLLITTRDGSSANVDVSSARTVSDIISRINAAGLNVTATYNDQGTGLAIRDMSGGTVSHLVISSEDDTAAKLGLLINSNRSVAQGSSLRAAYVSRNTRLSDMNQGQGVGDGSFTISDAAGKNRTINVSSLSDKTVGGMIDKINSLGFGITAQLNDDGNGIALIDTSGGPGTMKVSDNGTATIAQALGIAGSAQSQVVDGKVQKAIVGSQGVSIAVNASDTTATIAEKIRDTGRFASAASIGGRLEIHSRRGGGDGRLAVSTNGFDLGLSQTAKAQDAIVEVGEPGSAIQHYSSDNVFDNVISGISFTAKQVSDDPVTLSVERDDSRVVSQAKTFVDAYNRLMDRVSSLTSYDQTTNTVGLLFGSGETLRIQTQLGGLMTSRVNGAGSIKSLAEIGIKMTDTGKLKLDETRLNEKLSSDRSAVESFFTSKDTGFGARIKTAVDKIAGIDNSILLRRNQALQDRIDTNTQRIASFGERLSREESRLYTKFYAMEEAIASLQSNQQFLSGIAPLSALA